MYNHTDIIPNSPTLSARTVTSISSSISSIRTAEPVSADSTFVMISKADTQSASETYESLLSAAKSYRNQMIAFSQAAAGFGQALERIARCKGAHEAGSGLQAAAGLHYLMSNHQQLLSDTFYKQFEIPLLDNFDHHKSTIIANEEAYEKSISELRKKIKITEAQNLKNGRKRQRDLTQFRKALKDLTKQAEDLENLKNEYYKQTLENEQNNLNFILSKVSLVVKSEIDIFERICNKGTEDPLLEQMIRQGNDPFCTHQTNNQSLFPPSIYNNNNNANEISTSPATLTNLSTDNLGMFGSPNKLPRARIFSNDYHDRSTSSSLYGGDDDENEYYFYNNNNNNNNGSSSSNNNNSNTTSHYDSDEKRSSPLKINRSKRHVSNASDLSSLSPNSGIPSDNEKDGFSLSSSTTTDNHHHFLNIDNDSELLRNRDFVFDPEGCGLNNGSYDDIDNVINSSDVKDENDNTPNQDSSFITQKTVGKKESTFFSSTNTKPLFGTNSPFITRNSSAIIFA